MSARTLALGAGWLASLGLVFAIAQRDPAPAPAGAPRAAAASSSSGSVREPCVAGGSVAVPGGLTAETVRAIVREEIAGADGARAARADDAEESPGFAPALDFVEAALARGVWTSSDRDGLRAQLSGLTRAEVESLFAMVVPAANQGRLRVDGINGPLL